MDSVLEHVYGPELFPSESDARDRLFKFVKERLAVAMTLEFSDFLEMYQSEIEEHISIESARSDIWDVLEREPLLRDKVIGFYFRKSEDSFTEFSITPIQIEYLTSKTDRQSAAA